LERRRHVERARQITDDGARAPCREGNRVAQQNAQTVAALRQSLQQMPPDEAGCTGERNEGIAGHDQITEESMAAVGGLVSMFDPLPWRVKAVRGLVQPRSRSADSSSGVVFSSLLVAKLRMDPALFLECLAETRQPCRAVTCATLSQSPVGG